MKKRLWRGISAFLAFLLVFVSVCSHFANIYAGTINVALNTPTVKVVQQKEGGVTDTLHYKSEFGDFTAENHAKFLEAVFEQNIEEMKEGAVLIYNKDNALPLDKSKDRISFFGHANVEALLWGMAATSRSVDGLTGSWMVDDPTFLTQSNYVHLIPDAMRDAGFAINEDLWTTLKSTGTNVGRNSYGGGDAIGDANRMHNRQIGAAEAEDPISVYTDEVKSTWANDYQTAVLTLGRAGKEGQDMAVRDTVGDGRSSMALSSREEDLLSMLKEEKAAGRLNKIIVILNTGNQLEIGWLEEYDVDACIFVGALGNMGAIGLASILSGETNPSGHLTDTYAVNSLSAPAVVNANGNTPRYLNAEEIVSKIDGDMSGGITTPEQTSEMAEYMSFQAESIYIGYKYYETRYEDSVLKQGNANSAKGASNGASEWKYENEVSFPFGHGLSYTTFEQTLKDVKYNAETDCYEVTVEVKNTGSAAGKSVAQVYAQTPYGEYERNNRVEKSAVQLAGFDKTKLLQPDESQTLTVEVERYLLASYDYVNAKGYILSQGDYYLAIGEDAHDALNNILALKGADGMVDPEGKPVPGDAGKVYKFNNASVDTEAYKLSSEGVRVTNQFDDCDLNYWIPGAGTYLSRNDWDATYPVDTTAVAATEEMIEVLGGELYHKPDDAPTLAEAMEGYATSTNQPASITLVTMKDVPYEDSLWDDFLKQLTLDELSAVLTENRGTMGNPRIGVRDMYVADGCDGYDAGGNGEAEYVHVFDYEDTTGKYGSGKIEAANIQGARFAGNPIYAGTFNHDIYTRRGELIAENGLWRNEQVGWNVGVDLHRTPFGGRAFEYMSEDANLVYMASAPQVIAMQERGYTACPKHAFGNDQEFEREGVTQFFNEQAWREGSLRATEGALRVGKARSYMQSLSRVGLVATLSSYSVNTVVAREEWGFRGNVITDAISQSYMVGHISSSLMSGTDNYCLDRSYHVGEVAAKEIRETDDGEYFGFVVRAAKDYFYMVSRSNLINGMSSDSILVGVTPWWQTAFVVTIVALSVLTAAAVVLTLLAYRKENQGK